MTDYLVITIMAKQMFNGTHHESKERYWRFADVSSQIYCDFTVMNSKSFICSHLAISHQTQFLPAASFQMLSKRLP